MTKEELLENFRLDFHDIEYEIENRLKRPLTKKESTYIFLNFFRRKLGLSFSFENVKAHRAIFSITTRKDLHLPHVKKEVAKQKWKGIL